VWVRSLKFTKAKYKHRGWVFILHTRPDSHPVDLEATMGISKNVAGLERTGRIVLGIILIPLGFFLPGLWKPLFIVGGVSFILTAFVGY